TLPLAAPLRRRARRAPGSRGHLRVSPPGCGKGSWPVPGEGLERLTIDCPERPQVHRPSGKRLDDFGRQLEVLGERRARKREQRWVGRDGDRRAVLRRYDRTDNRSRGDGSREDRSLFEHRGSPPSIAAPSVEPGSRSPARSRLRVPGSAAGIKMPDPRLRKKAQFESEIANAVFPFGLFKLERKAFIEPAGAIEDVSPHRENGSGQVLRV